MYSAAVSSADTAAVGSLADTFNNNLERFAAASHVCAVGLFAVVLSPPDTERYNAVTCAFELAPYHGFLSL